MCGRAYPSIRVISSGAGFYFFHIKWIFSLTYGVRHVVGATDQQSSVYDIELEDVVDDIELNDIGLGDDIETDETALDDIELNDIRQGDDIGTDEAALDDMVMDDIKLNS